MNTAAVIVNHATPEWTWRAVWSLHSLYPNLPIRIIENGSPADTVTRLETLATLVPTVELICNNSNVHHGPGLDQGIRTRWDRTPPEWILLFDSDCIAFRHHFIEDMLKQAQPSSYMIGPMIYVDADGFNVDMEQQEALRYIHPHCALVRPDLYLELPPFEKHGAPCLTNQMAAAQKGYRLDDFPVQDYVFHLGRGTVQTTGYQLGWRSRIIQLKRLFRI